jgi:hypothetical protein
MQCCHAVADSDATSASRLSLEQQKLRADIGAADSAEAETLRLMQRNQTGCFCDEAHCWRRPHYSSRL